MPSIGGYSLGECKANRDRGLLELCSTLPRESERQTFQPTDEGTIVLCTAARRLDHILGRDSHEEVVLRLQASTHADPPRSRWHPKPESDRSRPFQVEVYMPDLLNDEKCRELIEQALRGLVGMLRYDGVELVDKTALWRSKRADLPKAFAMRKSFK